MKCVVLLSLQIAVFFVKSLYWGSILKSYTAVSIHFEACYKTELNKKAKIEETILYDLMHTGIDT